ncbi:MAG: CAP domain-containing protein [Actinobacteria bacterium]|nr:CAP domain-containing protein [Actinomycetota bacterium]
MQRASIILITSLLLLFGFGAVPANAQGLSASGQLDAAAETSQDPQSEVILFNMLNQARSDQGLAPLQRDPGLDAIAREWTASMSPTGKLTHRSDIVEQVVTRVTTSWQRVGENIGWGPSAEWLHSGFWNSAPHRANMLGDYNRIGIGALKESDGYVWVTVNFLKGPDLVGPTTPDGSSNADAADAWAVSPDGTVTPFGDAPHLGDPSDLNLARPIVGLSATPSGNGYWLVASDGGIFSYGDARFYGSTGAINQPIVAMAPTPSGNGYWLVASDGGIFSYGDARFYGSTGAITLPVWPRRQLGSDTGSLAKTAACTPSATLASRERRTA